MAVHHKDKNSSVQNMALIVILKDQSLGKRLNFEKKGLIISHPSYTTNPILTQHRTIWLLGNCCQCMKWLRFTVKCLQCRVWYLDALYKHPAHLEVFKVTAGLQQLLQGHTPQNPALNHDRNGTTGSTSAAKDNFSR